MSCRVLTMAKPHLIDSYSVAFELKRLSSKDENLYEILQINAIFEAKALYADYVTHSVTRMC